MNSNNKWFFFCMKSLVFCTNLGKDKFFMTYTNAKRAQSMDYLSNALRPLYGGWKCFPLTVPCIFLYCLKAGTEMADNPSSP